MSWTRLDDGWTDQQLLAGLSHETRWHYLCMILFCSRTQRFDGFIRAVDARRCSDVNDPVTALQDLADIGLIQSAPDGYNLPRMEEDHAPPLSVRNRTESNKQAQRRRRAHEAGNHGLCLSRNCEHASTDADSNADGHADKVDDLRTGQDRLRTKAPASPEVEFEVSPADSKAMQFRKWMENNAINSPAELARARSMDESEARKVWAMAYPGRKVA